MPRGANGYSVTVLDLRPLSPQPSALLYQDLHKMRDDTAPPALKDRRAPVRLRC